MEAYEIKKLEKVSCLFIMHCVYRVLSSCNEYIYRASYYNTLYTQYNYNIYTYRMSQELEKCRLRSVKPRNQSIDQMNFNVYSHFPEFSRKQLDQYMKLFYQVNGVFVYYCTVYSICVQLYHTLFICTYFVINIVISLTI